MRNLQIMDGQQRASSLTCLMAAIKSHLEKFAKESGSGSKRLEKIIDGLEDDFLFKMYKKSQFAS